MVHWRAMSDIPELSNEFRIMRHGRSWSNEEHLVNADPENDKGLVTEGYEQVEQSSTESGLGPNIVIVSSPMPRAYQSAELLQKITGAEDILVDERLRERGFGGMELESAGLYKDVWARDYVYADHHYRGAESIKEVAERGMDLVSDLERRFAKQTIVLTGHKDPLVILKAKLWGWDIRHHRIDFSLDNAEIQLLARMRQH